MLKRVVIMFIPPDTWKGLMAIAAYLLVYHGPLQIATFLGVAGHLLPLQGNQPCFKPFVIGGICQYGLSLH